jgi:hypothetical protein
VSNPDWFEGFVQELSKPDFFATGRFMSSGIIGLGFGPEWSGW